MPLLSGDYSDIGDLDDAEYSDESPPTESPAGRSSADRTKRSPKAYEVIVIIPLLFSRTFILKQIKIFDIFFSFPFILII